MSDRTSETNVASTAASQVFIDQPELLRRLKISRKTAFNWERSGKLPVVKISRKKLFHWPSVEACLLRHQRNSFQ
jgi:predicted site-specific integrase-resolvase